MVVLDIFSVQPISPNERRVNYFAALFIKNFSVLIIDYVKFAVLRQDWLIIIIIIIIIIVIY